MFTARIFPSQGDRFQLEPGDSSPVGRGYRRDWLGGEAEVGQPQLLCAWGPDLVPILWETQGGPSKGTARLLEKQWEALGTRDLTSASQEHGWSYPLSPHFLSWCMHQEEVPP